MEYSILWILLLFVGSSQSTHVNITISQQHSKNVGLTADSHMNADAQHKGDSTEYESRSAKLQAGDKAAQGVAYGNHRIEEANVISPMASENRMNQRAHLVGHPQLHFRSMYQSNPIEYQRNAQFRKMDENQKQNVEFERYIQHYHSGPTVETVYESAEASPSHSSSVKLNDGPQRSGKIIQFERQVALPSAATDAESQLIPSSTQHHPSQAALAQEGLSAPTSVASSSSSPSTSAATSASASTTNGNSLNTNLNQRPASVGSDGLNFDSSISYNKPNYNDANRFKYSNEDSQFFNQYPPSVEEPQGGYGGYYHQNNQDGPSYVSNGYEQPHTSGQSYLPPETINQRPVVTKTIQIAQPAIKTKKYEVRHPAIQKEFYDIEERVVIKPAGTVVVELERPVAKIPKGESILPLGHPHPAVAGAYRNTGSSPSFSNTIYSAAGASNPTSQANNQYSHGSFYSPKQIPEQRPSVSGTTIGSSITTTPNFDQNSRVESNTNKANNGELHYALPTAAPVREEPKGRNRELIVVTDGQGNQRQVSPEQFAYSRESAERSHPRSGYNLRSYANNNQKPQRTNLQSPQSNQDAYNFDAEYINVGNSGNVPRDAKPARLEQAPVRMEPVIKHEHNIALPPSQHKIYLTQKHAIPEARYVEETAHVQEVKPYLINHPGPVVIYGSTKHRPELSFRQRGSEYQQPQSQGANYRSNGVSNNLVGSSQIEISSPYAQMRYHPGDQATTGHQTRKQYSGIEVDSPKLGKLLLENKTPDEMSTHSKIMNMSHSTHIEVNIPPSSQNSNKVIAATLRPMMSDDGEHMGTAKLEISVTNNSEPKKVKTQEDEMVDNSEVRDKEQLNNSRDTPDCEKINPGHMDQKFMRLVDAPNNAREETATAAENSAPSNIQASNVHNSNRDTASQAVMPRVTPGSRVIAAAPAPSDSSAGSESFHKRRIVVNHPFQTVREVVEHEPYTNYHEVQVNEPASPALYHSAAYFQTHGALRHPEGNLAEPIFYH
uniref:DUF4794 domain-containing protein n=1 Tax=Stomoxys calcitrans TaxID=35570 RepID=A0A1I8PVU4_STOCA